MELANDFKTLNGTIHFGTLDNHKMSSVVRRNFTGGDGQWHTYGLEWRRLQGGSSQVFKWFVDGNYYGSVPSPGRPFNVQSYSILLNLAVGGNFTEWDAGRLITVADTQAMLREKPRTMEVDWVRVIGKS